MALVTNQIRSALDLDQSFQEEVYTENLDAADLSEDAQKKQRDSLVLKYRHNRMDLIVLVGPDPVGSLQSRRRRFTPTFRLCSVALFQGKLINGIPIPDPQGRGSTLDSAKTLDAALRLLPETRQLFVVAASPNSIEGSLRSSRQGSILTRIGLTSRI
jgi:hypothetical protein